MPEDKAGTRKGRLNYAAEFKQRLAEAACQRDVSIARLALEHGLNANMVHKWRRKYLAAMAAQAQSVPTQFLPVTLAPVETTVVNPSAQVIAPRAVKLAPPRQSESLAGTIEIKFGGATVCIDGLVDTSMLAIVLSHFHP